MAEAEIDGAIREILGSQGRLHVDVASLDDEDNLFSAGLSSFANVNVMLALEDHFGIEFPDDMLRRSSFESVSAIRAAVCRLAGQEQIEVS